MSDRREELIGKLLRASALANGRRVSTTFTLQEWGEDGFLISSIDTDITPPDLLAAAQMLRLDGMREAALDAEAAATNAALGEKKGSG